jgi:hypothetical protein
LWKLGRNETKQNTLKVMKIKEELLGRWKGKRGVKKEFKSVEGI